jgi:hypothetical protein
VGLCHTVDVAHRGQGYSNTLEIWLKGTGTRDYNWLKVVWHDGSWLGESPADIQKIFTVPLILY